MCFWGWLLPIATLVPEWRTSEAAGLAMRSDVADAALGIAPVDVPLPPGVAGTAAGLACLLTGLPLPPEDLSARVGLLPAPDGFTSSLACLGTWLDRLPEGGLDAVEAVPEGTERMLSPGLATGFAPLACLVLSEDRPDLPDWVGLLFWGFSVIRGGFFI